MIIIKVRYEQYVNFNSVQEVGFHHTVCAASIMGNSTVIDDNKLLSGTNFMMFREKSTLTYRVKVPLYTYHLMSSLT
ncbi:hypothetical protein DA456_24760 [Pseudomonas syringae pv. atrofaciens]|uniref:Uncharacterized protein n=1 Tax=Pseudomonas syringae pv. atrofaciens TaxID=192087 RepID=A0AAD0MXT7_PSESX|nr:hypothetical protein DA456_24760 [Pseudomonas syringae pv. atrofaciens]